MKKIFFLIIFLLASCSLFAQGELKGVMGINFMSVPSMQDYINQKLQPKEQVGSFVSAVIFSGEGGIFIQQSFIVTFELAYQIYSFTEVNPAGKEELSFDNLMPSFLAYYVLSGEGYNFKFGGGAGIRFTSVDLSLPATGTTTGYNSTGFGGILRIEGNTLLGGSVYANIGVELRYDANGEPENNGTPLVNNIANENVNFNAFSTGMRLGITYIIGASD